MKTVVEQITETSKIVRETLQDARRDVSATYSIRPDKIPNYDLLPQHEQEKQLKELRQKKRFEVYNSFNAKEIELHHELKSVLNKWNLQRLSKKNGFDIINKMAKDLQVSPEMIDRQVEKIANNPNISDALNRVDQLTQIAIARNPKAFNRLDDCENKTVAMERLESIKKADEDISTAFKNLDQIKNRRSFTRNSVLSNMIK